MAIKKGPVVLSFMGGGGIDDLGRGDSRIVVVDYFNSSAVLFENGALGLLVGGVGGDG